MEEQYTELNAKQTLSEPSCFKQEQGPAYSNHRLKGIASKLAEDSHFETQNPICICTSFSVPSKAMPSKTG